jgi:hypothetical protein
MFFASEVRVVGKRSWVRLGRRLWLGRVLGLDWRRRRIEWMGVSAMEMVEAQRGEMPTKIETGRVAWRMKWHGWNGVVV